MHRHNHIQELWHFMRFLLLIVRALSVPTGSSCPDQPVTILLCHPPCNPFPRLRSLAACCRPWPCFANPMSGLGGGPAPTTQTCGVMARLLAEPRTATGQFGSSSGGTRRGPSVLSDPGAFNSKKEEEVPILKWFLKQGLLCSPSRRARHMSVFFFG